VNDRMDPQGYFKLPIIWRLDHNRPGNLRANVVSRAPQQLPLKTRGARTLHLIIVDRDFTPSIRSCLQEGRAALMPPLSSPKLVITRARPV
jgi:hypothetical protein